MNRADRTTLAMGRMIFPRITLRNTRVMYWFGLRSRVVLPNIKPLPVGDYQNSEFAEYDTVEIELKQYGYKSWKRKAYITCGYYEEEDMLIVKPTEFTSTDVPYKRKGKS